MMNDDEQELTTREAAEYLGWSATAGLINRLVRAGQLPARKHGVKSYRIRVADLDMLKSKHQPDAPAHQTALPTTPPTPKSKRQPKPRTKRQPQQAASQAVDDTKRLTVDEAAQRLNVTPERVYQLLALGSEQGGITGEQRGGSWEIAINAVKEFQSYRKSAGRPTQQSGEWISQSVAAQLYGTLRGRTVSRQAVGDLIARGKLRTNTVDGVRCVARRDIIKLANGK